MNNELWNEINEMFMNSSRQVIINTESLENGAKAIDVLRITSNSVLGSVVLNSSGIVVDNWIRVFGHDCKSNRGIITYNNIDSSGIATKIKRMLIIADDVVGGIFALNAGKFNTGIGDVWYFAPDTLDWESLGLKYSEFLAWIAQGSIDDFYSTMRWNSWKDICKKIKFDEAISIYPFLWSNELQIESADKKIVPAKELFEINQEFSGKL